MSNTTATLPRAAGTGGSVVVAQCQVCDSRELEPIIFVGYLPPVNAMPPIGTRPSEQPAYPAQVLRCTRCSLVQLGLIVDPAILFPPSYPYLSGSTKILRDDFAELYRESSALLGLDREDLVVDVGSNDGTLLRNFKDAGHQVRGIEPTQAGALANERDIPTDIAFFDRSAADSVVERQGRARIVTATNVFAHIEGVHDVVEAILAVLADDGVFISESHYWLSLVQTLQYDAIYHEHLRYYTLASLAYLFGTHGLQIIHAKRIPTHGGSIRVYAARKGTRAVQPSVAALRGEEDALLTDQAITRFREGVVTSKLELHALLRDVKGRGEHVYGIGAPSRASTLINYVGLDHGIVDCVLEVEGSHKIGKYIPGTLIPVLHERKLFEDQPEQALLLSWHIADELIPKLRRRGFRGSFIVPLPEPRVVRD